MNKQEHDRELIHDERMKQTVRDREVIDLVDVIRTLERETGNAPYDAIIEEVIKNTAKRTATLLDDLERAQIIFEPVRYSKNYRLTTR